TFDVSTHGLGEGGAHADVAPASDSDPQTDAIGADKFSPSHLCEANTVKADQPLALTSGAVTFLKEDLRFVFARN
ncbi:MAG TPA: hypothetical protein VGF45_12325, partial [Polyangia bacterium]